MFTIRVNIYMNDTWEDKSKLVDVNTKFWSLRHEQLLRQVAMIESVLIHSGLLAIHIFRTHTFNFLALILILNSFLCEKHKKKS